MSPLLCESQSKSKASKESLFRVGLKIPWIVLLHGLPTHLITLHTGEKHAHQVNTWYVYIYIDKHMHAGN